MNKALSPVILIPGFTGSRLKTRWKDLEDYDLWLNLKAMQQGAKEKAQTTNTDGSIDPTEWWLAEISLAKDGITPLRSPDVNGPVQGLEAISILDHEPGQREKTRYFWNLIHALREIGYDDSNLRAAPYDWRSPPTGLELRSQYFTRLKATIEELVNNHPAKPPATLIGHSLGNRMIQYFLQMMLAEKGTGQAWIDRYIGRYIAVSALWLGVPKSIREALTGATGLGLTQISGLKPVYQSYGALPWMLPVTKAQYPYLNTAYFAFLQSDQQPLGIDEALALGAQSTLRYTREFFLENPNFTQKGEPLGSLAVLPPPVARLNVLHATGQNTEVGAYYYDDSDGLNLDTAAKSSDPNFSVIDGVRYETAEKTVQKIDGTHNSGDTFLPYGSLRYFTIWQQEYPAADITGKAFPGLTHYSILQDEMFLKTVVELLEQPLQVNV